MLPRHPNVIWELLAADAVFESLIVDGRRLPPATVKAMIHTKDPSRTMLVDRCWSLPPHLHPVDIPLAPWDCELSKNSRVGFPGTPYLAGSSLTLNRAIVNTVG